MVQHSLILGNGFNKALGLCVDYSDFFGSSEWKSVKTLYKDTEIIKYLAEQVEKKNHKIEICLENYLDITTEVNAQKDKIAFRGLEMAFSKFVDNTIKGMPARNFNQDSKAFHIMSKYNDMRNKLPDEDAVFIYSFNYVKYDDIRKKFDGLLCDDIQRAENGNFKGNPWGGSDLKVSYNHGMSSGGKSDAIFGLSLDAFQGKSEKLMEEYKFLLKECHDNYPIKDKEYLTNSLFESATIEFFGFGFTNPDIPYVKKWLKSQPTFDGIRDITLYNLKEEKTNLIDILQNVSGDNWQSFCSHYNIKFCYEDNTEESFYKIK